MLRKHLSYLLSIYIFALTLVPCVDDDISSACMNSVINNIGHPQQDEHQDHCSPFCHCSCCSLSIEVSKPFVLNEEYTPWNTIVYFFNPQIKSSYIFSIWEPPKSCIS